jgi:hypothetical protein
MSLFRLKYDWLCKTPSDINEHLPVLYKYAKECNHVTECGVRNVVSSYAFAVALLKNPNAKLIQIDPFKDNSIDEFVKLCKDYGINARFYNESDLKCPLEKTDLLFIDTWHVYAQLKRELERWNGYVSKYIILHDTTVDAEKGETIRSGSNGQKESRESGFPVAEITKGLWPAVEEFLESHKEWKLKERLMNNNGLTVLMREHNAEITL